MLPHKTGIRRDFPRRLSAPAYVRLREQAVQWILMHQGGWRKSFSIYCEIQLIKFSILPLLEILIAWDKVLVDL